MGHLIRAGWFLILNVEDNWVQGLKGMSTKSKLKVFVENMLIKHDKFIKTRNWLSKFF